MAVNHEKVTVATCDAPSCTVQRIARDEAVPQGYHLTIVIQAEDGGRTLEAFSHSEAHIGPAARQAIREWTTGDRGDDGDAANTAPLDGPIVPDGGVGQDTIDDLDADDADADADADAPLDDEVTGVSPGR